MGPVRSMTIMRTLTAMKSGLRSGFARFTLAWLRWNELQINAGAQAFCKRAEPGAGCSQSRGPIYYV